ncbi:MAG TPA: flagellar biosynthetic protein FliP [Cyanobacteria bacterium UBA8530]|nr:flagellar biosynthetic protein FliP [Cyanobacteria bacterium UBA8530]
MGLLTVLSLAPALLIMMTSFTRIVIVLSFLRQAMGTMTMPPNQVILGLALFLTFFVMATPLGQINHDALQPYLAGNMGQQEAIQKGVEPLRNFMFHQTRQKDLALFVHMAKIARPRTPADIPTHILIPAFLISELKTAFQIGFMIYLPFLVIDMVVSSILMSMGMMMLPPVMISLPFKIILFVLVDGWHLISRALVASFH